MIAGIAFVLIVCCLELLDRTKNKLLRRLLMLLGALSMSLWFLHGIFFTGKNFMQAELYAVKEPVLIFLLCLVVLTLVAYLFQLGYNKLLKLFERTK